MNGLRKTLHERIAEEKKRHEQSRLALADLQARARILDRKLDARRKIVAGALTLAHAERNSAFHQQFARLAQANMRPQDRVLFPEFFPEAEPAPVPPARPLKLPRDPPSGAAPT